MINATPIMSRRLLPHSTAVPRRTSSARTFNSTGDRRGFGKVPAFYFYSSRCSPRGFGWSEGIARKDAEHKAKIATSRQLAALSASERDKRLDRSLLLAVEAVQD